MIRLENFQNGVEQFSTSTLTVKYPSIQLPPFLRIIMELTMYNAPEAHDPWLNYHHPILPDH